jgi:hypothetical protein
MLFRVTFASVVFLLIVFTWALTNYCQDERDVMASMHTKMKPAYTYFDWNRQESPISSMTIQKAGTTCSSIAGSKLERIFAYEGNVAGYKLASGTFKVGTKPTDTTGDNVDANSVVNAYNFGGYEFCATEMKLSTLGPRASGGTCTAPNEACSECFCSTKASSSVKFTTTLKKTTEAKAYTVYTKLCPLQTYKVTKTASTTKELYCKEK